MNENSGSPEDDSGKPGGPEAEASNRPSGSGGTSAFVLGKARKRFDKGTRYRRKNSEDGASEAGGSGVRVSSESEPAESASVSDRVKKRARTQTCGRRTNSDEADAGGSGEVRESSEAVADTATFHKLQKRVKHRSYRRTTSDCEDDGGGEAVAATCNEAEAKTDEESSSTESETNDEKEAEDDSDDGTTTEEEANFVPLVLRKIRPKSTLSLVNEVMNRQIGRSARFDKKLYGSLHMVERLKYLHSLDEHQGCVNTVEFNRRGDLLVSGSDDLAIIVWNWATGRKLRSYESGHRNNIMQATWIPRDDLSIMLTCASDGQVRFLDLISGSTRKLAMHNGACNKFAIHLDTPHIAISVGDDGKVLSIDIRDGETTKLVTMKERAFAVQLYTIHSNPRNGNEFCVGGHSESVKIYDRRKASTPLFKLCPKNLIDNERVHVTSVTYNHDGTEILASYNDDDIYLFDTLIPHPNGDYAHKYEGHRNSRTIKGVNFFGPKSEFIVSGSDCGNIYFWEKNTEAIVQCMPGDAQGVVNRVKPHPYIPVLATSGLDDDVKIWVPSADKPPAFSELKECVTANMNDRAEGRPQCRNRYDGNLFCIILEHLCQNRELVNLLSESRSDGTFDEDDDDED